MKGEKDEYDELKIGRKYKNVGFEMEKIMSDDDKGNEN
jgi:hypothetical protein